MRLLQALEGEGYIQRELDRQTFTLGPTLSSLSLRTLQHSGVSQRYRAVLRKLVQLIGETCNLTTLAEGMVLYLDRVETSHPLRMTLHQLSQHGAVTLREAAVLQLSLIHI